MSSHAQATPLARRALLVSALLQAMISTFYTVDIWGDGSEMHVPAAEASLPALHSSQLHGLDDQTVGGWLRESDETLPFWPPAISHVACPTSAYQMRSFSLDYSIRTLNGEEPVTKVSQARDDVARV